MLRSVLRWLVRFYRRRLSGRGPFAQVRCTFSGMESCSAFAERTLAETPSTLRAVLRILRRLGRCRGLSLYRLPGGRLGWGKDYDAVLTAVSPQAGACRLDSLLGEDGEGESVRAAVRGAAALVAAAAEAPHRAAAVLSAPSPALRDAEGLRRTFRRRLHRGCLLAAAATASGMAAFLTGFGALALGCCLLVALLGLVRARAAQTMLRRLDWLEILASIAGPF